MSSCLTLIPTENAYSSRNLLAILTLVMLSMMSATSNAGQGLPVGFNLEGVRFAWHPQDESVLAESSGQTVTVRRVAPPEILNVFTISTATVVAVSWSPNGDHLAIAEAYHVSIYDKASVPSDSQLVGEINLLPSDSYYGISSLEWNPQGTQLLAAAPQKVFLWDALTGQEVRVFPPAPMVLLSAAWSPDGTFIATGDLVGRVVVENLTTHEAQMNESLDYSAIFAMVWHPDSSELIAGTGSGLVDSYFPQTLGLASNTNLQIESESVILSIDWHPIDHDVIATGSLDGFVRIVQLPDIILETIDAGQPVVHVEWNATGETFAYSAGETLVIRPNPDWSF